MLASGCVEPTRFLSSERRVASFVIGVDGIPDQGILSVGGIVRLTGEARDSLGARIENPGAITFGVADTSVVNSNASGLVTAVAGGMTTVLGHLVTPDSVFTAAWDVWVVTFPELGKVTRVTAGGFSPDTTFIAEAQYVTWLVSPSVRHRLTFDRGAGQSVPADVGLVQDTSVMRVFAAAGSFPYSCMLHPTERGVVKVQ